MNCATLNGRSHPGGVRITVSELANDTKRKESGARETTRGFVWRLPAAPRARTVSALVPDGGTSWGGNMSRTNRCALWLLPAVFGLVFLLAPRASVAGPGY